MIKNRLSALRKWMQSNDIEAFIIPSNDSHFSEYVAPHWGCRSWISGFDGSAGTVVVTTDASALWTDSRYFLQAESQLSGSGIALQKMGLPDTPTIGQWLKATLPDNSTVGVDGKLFSVNGFASMAASLKPLRLIATADPFIEIWADRPTLPTAPAFRLAEKYTGESHLSKIERLRATYDSGTLLVSVLDDIAWLLNIRGADIAYNPLVVAYLAIEPDAVKLFVGKGKISDIEGVTIENYDGFDEYLTSLSGRDVICNPDRFDRFHYNILQRSGAILHDESCAVGQINMMKSVKNEAEIEGFRHAMVTDGVALTRFMIWLEETLRSRGGVSEWEAMCRLTEFRAAGEEFVGESFTTIMGYKSNGAIVHYTASAESSAEIRADGFLLIDSGGQYLCGTTDITRTMHLSSPTPAERRDYTNVLRGMIDLSSVTFPAGTRGTQLDILARRYMLADCTNFLHGTGHGVGSFLCVHEGPQSIRMNENPITLLSGMVQSNEPAVYRTGEYGIRTENMMLCRDYKQSDFGRFMNFETLTLFPIDTVAIDTEAMDKAQIQWLNTYHKEVYDRLSPHLSPKEKTWLKCKTQPI